MRYAFLSTRKSPGQDFQRKNHPAHELAPGGATTSLAKGESYRSLLLHTPLSLSSAIVPPHPRSTPLAGVRERQPIKAPKAGSLFIRDNPPNTELRRFYERGDLPVSIEHRGVGNRIQWKVQFLDSSTHHSCTFINNHC
jgi:hypothetical protein